MSREGWAPPNKTSDADLGLALGAYLQNGKSRTRAAEALGLTLGCANMRIKRALARGVRPRVRVAAGRPAVDQTLDRIVETVPEGIDQTVSAALHARIISGAGVRRFVITSAQNATPVHAAFLDSVLTYCRHRGAELLVIPYRYRNPTSRWSAEAEHDDWWAPELAPYLIDRRTELNSNLLLLADIKTQPTATSPVTGFETLSGSSSAIIGHPKVEMTTVPVPHPRMPKILLTTGSITERNYTPTKAGKKGEHHHVFGAALAEVDGDLFHLRQLIACDDGSFCDLDLEYSGAAIAPSVVEALVLGDVHVDFADPDVIAATFDGPESIAAVLKPKRIVLHDLLDFYSRNHHHAGAVFTNFAKHHAGMNDVEAELDRAFAFVDRYAIPGAETIIVGSNHNDALGRWVKEADPKSDPTNAVFWAKTFQAMLNGTTMTPNGSSTIDPVAYWGRLKLKTAEKVTFLGRDESCVVASIELGLHGDLGPNGSRGSRRNHTKIGTKVMIGHSHSPGISDGAWQCGTSTRRRLEYNGGLSSWLNTHGIVFSNGKRCLITIINGAWRK